MRRCARAALVVLCSVMFAFRGWGDSLLQIPKESDGYKVTHTDSTQQPPSGYTGRTDLSTAVAVGITPATEGRTVTTHFVLGAQVPLCPQADGTIDGTGEFSISVQSTSTQPDATSTGKVEMRATAKFKGEVGENAHIEGFVNAEIDYSLTQTGSIRDRSGAMLSPAGGSAHQHVTIPVAVLEGFKPPELGAFSGGDPTQGQYVEAFATGMILAYWGGIYYSVAETNWLSGNCAVVTFNPPSKSVVMAPGTQTTILTEVKTKDGGQVVRGHFEQDGNAGGGGVEMLSGGLSDVGYPLKINYTAPDKKGTTNPGFGVKATSRAGMAGGEWDTSLGADWSGTISCTQDSEDHGHNDLQTWDYSSKTVITITVNNGVGTLSGSSEGKGSSLTKQPALRGGVRTFIDESSDKQDQHAEESQQVKVQASIDTTDGTYAVNFEPAGDPPTPPHVVGEMHDVMWNKNAGTHETKGPAYVEGICKPITGKLAGPNNLSGSLSDSKSNLGTFRTGTMNFSQTWNLTRSGTSK